MKRFFVVAAVLVAALLGLNGSIFGGITVGEEHVTVSMTVKIASLTCDTWNDRDYDFAWDDLDCNRPGETDENVFGLTWTHLKIITADNQCLLFNGRIDPAVVGFRDLVMNIPIGVPITDSNVTFGPGSEYGSIDIYDPKSDDPLTLERESSYRIEITEQPRTCDSRQTAEYVLAWAVVDIPKSCCKGMTGDVDGCGSVDIADASYLLSWLFSGGPPPPCKAEADVDGSGQADINDVNYLLEWLFQGGPDPVACP
jgi:hypothetical protein